MRKIDFIKLLAVSLPVFALTAMTAGTADAATQSSTHHVSPKIQLTSHQKEVLKQARELHQEGKDSEIPDLLSQAGLPDRAFRRASGSLASKEIRQRHRQMIEAIENNDYQSFKAITAGTKFGDKVDEAVFSKLVEAYDLKQQGDDQGAKTLIKSLNLRKKN